MPTYDPKKSTTDVRQANPRKMNFRVLIISLVAIVIVLALVFGYSSMMSPAQA